MPPNKSTLVFQFNLKIFRAINILHPVKLISYYIFKVTYFDKCSPQEVAPTLYMLARCRLKKKKITRFKPKGKTKFVFLAVKLQRSETQKDLWVVITLYSKQNVQQYLTAGIQEHVKDEGKNLSYISKAPSHITG